MSFDCEITHIRNQVQIVELITLSVCEGEMKWTRVQRKENDSD